MNMEREVIGTFRNKKITKGKKAYLEISSE